MLLAHEITRPPHRAPAANEGSYARRPMRIFELEVRLVNGHTTTLTTVARNSAAAIDHADDVFGDQIDGVKPRALS